MADARLKKHIVRALVQEVIVDVDSKASEVFLVRHWKGGLHTEVRVPRRHRGQNATPRHNLSPGVLTTSLSTDLLHHLLQCCDPGAHCPDLRETGKNASDLSLLYQLVNFRNH